ncbi:unnamed protein product [Dibothriocephalus latus]|uniref:DH domain-containing protein n=1 Tax=Dibothriocephalus latus TaxID=60516 RepID=A0A3P7N0T3_DIBLA|nr:unnamed protein product [Dibothriocephalus latus]
MDSLLAFREQPLLELCNSEESYVQRLQFVCDTYIRIKLKILLHSQPDAIPELFLSSCSRMRSMYMKYCENHLKAIALVAQHKTYFEELRMYFFDRDDILSHLMQPIQRVTRYQLPMVQALKITERANSPSREIWREAVTLLKDIPNDVQMIMEVSKVVSRRVTRARRRNQNTTGAIDGTPQPP